MEYIKKLRRAVIKVKNSLVSGFGFFLRKIHAPKIPVNSEGKVYVNLGCGKNTSKEFINIDTRTMPNVHYIAEVQKLPMLKNNSVDLLYASHLLEHIPRNEVPMTLGEWYRVLKPGGVLRFGVPDFDALIKVYGLSQNDVTSIENQLLGQTAPYDDHHTIWNFNYAEKLLKEANFRTIRTWDYKTATHHDFIDKSMREVQVAGESILISLNIEAVK
ncbi:MAG: methyltransferase domain-containing protein [Patescibacteria group bacterium]